MTEVGHNMALQERSAATKNLYIHPRVTIIIYRKLHENPNSAPFSEVYPGNILCQSE